MQMARLRKKLIQAGAGTQPIKAVRHFGYQLCARLTLVLTERPRHISRHSQTAWRAADVLMSGRLS